MFNIKIFGTKFYSKNKIGDFDWMCKQSEYSDSLFIFNDNEEFHNSCRPGSGNAIMRKYNKYSDLEIPRSAGIPTGTLKNGGYQIFRNDTKKNIDNSIIEIIDLIIKYKYNKIFYSSEENGLLGTSIFNVDNDVLLYITSKIHSLTSNDIQIIKYMENDNP